VTITLDAVDSRNPSGAALARWNAHFLESKKELFIEAPSSMAAASKETLVSLLDLAEGLGCERVWMFIDSNRSDFRAATKLFNFLGFRLARRGGLGAEPSSSSLVFLCYEVA